MPQISRSALVTYSAERMYDLVNDVRAYPEFLPWCGMTEVIQESSDEMLARIQVSKGSVRHAFTTRNSLVRPSEIILTLVDGPFRKLQGRWSFLALDEAACKVALALEYELTGALTGVALGPVFSQAAGTMVDAFCKRAQAIYR
nr:type II toxin-antitoxin system RatA family toxin [Hahella chejuensis]